MMVCAQVFGNDAAITWRERRQFRLSHDAGNGHDLLESIPASANVVDFFCEKSRTESKRTGALRRLVELFMANVTALAPKIGYDRAAEIAKEAFEPAKTVGSFCREKKILPEKNSERASTRFP